MLYFDKIDIFVRKYLTRDSLQFFSLYGLYIERIERPITHETLRKSSLSQPLLLHEPQSSKTTYVIHNTHVQSGCFNLHLNLQILSFKLQIRTCLGLSLYSKVSLCILYLSFTLAFLLVFVTVEEIVNLAKTLAKKVHSLYLEIIV